MTTDLGQCERCGVALDDANKGSESILTVMRWCADCETWLHIESLIQNVRDRKEKMG